MAVAERLTVDLAQGPPGWFNHRAQVLALLDEYRPRVVVELGTWMGASAIAMARSVRRWGGTVTCVDTWAGELDEAGGTVAGKPPFMLFTCGRSIVQAGVGASVRLIPSTTLDAGREWRGPIEFLYVDADHSEAGVAADLAAWVPHVVPGGLIVGDDYGHPRYPGVKRAWDEFAVERGISLTRYQSDPPRADGVQLVYGMVV